ncbi:hypothetical protein N0V88_006438 [Collariella sp. IMI 366227]|nr:hypothetical protein N0V88_006438 [Collariella sp. IMI 366227]
MDAHEAIVASVSTRIQQFHETKTPFRVYHGSTNSTRKSQRRHDNTVDTSRLNRVLNVDTTRKTALVEPNVPMDALVEATLDHNLVPLVVMEFPGITVGGGFSGTSGESSSFRYGAFEATINWIEIVLPHGETSFWGAASAFGTLGVVTLLEVQLRDAAPYVELTYHHITDFNDVVTALQSATSPDTPNDYVDAITFSRTSTILCTGRLAHSLPLHQSPELPPRSRPLVLPPRPNHPQTPHLPSPNPIITNRLHPLRSYLFRHDRGAFWTASYAFRYFLVPLTFITRFLLDPFLHARVMYRALHQSGLSDFYVVQDVGIPFRNAARGLEQAVCGLDGRKWLYAHAYYTEEEFWAQYDRPAYDALREKYGAGYLPSVYDKIKVDVDAEEVAARASWTAWLLAVFWMVWPMRGLYGVYKAIIGGLSSPEEEGAWE